MAVTHGMNVAEVRVLGELLRSRGERLALLVGEVDRVAYAVDWSGADATEFVREWPTHRARLLACAEHLSGLGRSALNNASEQEQASRTVGSTASVPMHGPGGWGAFGERARRGTDLVVTGTDTGTFIREDLLRQDLSRTMTRVSAGAFVVGTGLHGVEYIRALVEGDTGGVVVGTGRLVLDAGSILNPYVRAGNLGVGIGELITDNTQLDETIADNVVTATMYRDHGTTELTPSQAADLTERYSGVSGFGNSLADGGRTAWENFTGLFR